MKNGPEYHKDVAMIEGEEARRLILGGSHGG